MGGEQEENGHANVLEFCPQLSVKRSGLCLDHIIPPWRLAHWSLEAVDSVVGWIFLDVGN